MHPFSALRGLVLVVVLFVAGAALFAGCGSDGASSDDLDVKNPRLVQAPNGQRSFTGTLVNEQSRTVPIAQIEVALYDDTGSPVETVQIDVKDIPAQDSVDFSHRIDSNRPFSQAQVQGILTP